MRPFRILIVEDDFGAIKPALDGKPYPAGNEYHFLTLLFKEQAIPADGRRVPIEVYWSRSANFAQVYLLETGAEDQPFVPDTEKNCVFRIFPPTDSESEDVVLLQDAPPVRAFLRRHLDIEVFLSGIDVLVLDLGGLGGALPDADLAGIKQRFERVTGGVPEDLEESLQTAKTSFPGIYFYHHFHNALQGCQFVVILSAYDEGEATDQSVVKSLLHPFCGLNAHTPYTVKYGKDKVTKQAAKASLHSRIRCLFQDYRDGYTQLRHLGPIEQAAHHDMPVLIVGESGTGKEYVARSIHRRWLAERQREDSSVEDNFVVVNCAGLTSELARSELFGHVAGSFTGATDHRLGAIMKACGLRGFKKTLDSERKKAEEAGKKAKELAEAVDDLTRQPDSKKEYFFKQHVVSALRATIADDQNALVVLLSAIRRKLENAAYGDDLVQDYYTGLIKRNDAYVEAITIGEDEEYLGIQFRHDRPVGTLFLDEFGDLPPEVQNLLLRFLEEKSGEIQPLGYSGRIASLKVRLILATSDPRIAKFAGYDLLGSKRSRAIDPNRDQPFRNDLLFRVKGQVIKTEAISTQVTLMETLDEMIGRHFPNEWTWSPEAKEYLAGRNGKITQILDALDGRGDDAETNTMVFGQRRELKRIIDLVARFMASARARGLRLASDEVTEEIVKEVWKPSELLMTKPAEVTTQPRTDDKLPDQAVLDRVTAQITEFFAMNGIKFERQAKHPGEWAKALSAIGKCNAFLELTDSLTKANNKSLNKDEIRAFEIIMQQPKDTKNRTSIRWYFQPGQDKKRRTPKA